MTAKEYDDYVARFREFMKGMGLANLSSKCNDNKTGCIEPFFSWRPCPVCGCHLGGDREDCNGYNPTTKEIVDVDGVCTNCTYFAKYGRLDDTTMAEVHLDRQQNPAPAQEE